MNEVVEIEKEALNKLLEALKHATHPDYEECGAKICEEITEALKAFKDGS